MVAQLFIKQIGQEPASIYYYCLRHLLKVLLFIYDIVSFIPFKIFANPESKLQYANRRKAAPTVENDPSSSWRACCILPDQAQGDFYKCKTMAEVWNKALEKHQNLPCFGSRTFISSSDEVQSDGRIFEKLELGPYRWRTFAEVNQNVEAIMKGLVETDHQLNERVLIYSETREEFTTTLLACLKSIFPVTTVYTTLGLDALTYSIQQCKPTTIFATPKLLNTVSAALKDTNTVKRVIYYSHRDPMAVVVVPDKLKQSNIRILSYEKLIEIGNESAATFKHEVKPDDVAMIMYTSGTTADPKGVVLSHRNLVASIKAHNERFQMPGLCYAAYLPLAHIFEICAELTVLTRGYKLGFSSPLTLVDGAPGLKKGQRGDCSLLKPTFFVGTPAIFNRIIHLINDSVSKTVPWKQELFKCVYEYLDKRHDKGYSDTFLGRLVFQKIQEITGGNVQLLFSAGAPINPESLRFMKICFGCPFTQGFACTETTGSGTFSYRDCLHSDEVGPPEFGCEVMLREWSEGGYSPHNTVPQGEILIGGDNVAVEYLNNEEQTKEAFLEIDGKRWFATGDIGEVRPDGSFRIIDRKKDLVKLAQGEYISLGKVEAFIASMSYIENICIYGNQMRDYVIAIVVPRQDKLFSLARAIGIFELNYEKLCQNEAVKEQLLKEIYKYCKGKLNKMEIPRKLYLCPKIWTPDDGLVTAAFKIKRKCIEKKYEKEIQALYS